MFLLVGVTGIEPATSWSQTTRAPICATPRRQKLLYDIMDKKSTTFYAFFKKIYLYLRNGMKITPQMKKYRNIR